MKDLSVIIPTIGRVDELDKLLATLQAALSSVSYEIIIVDQNTNQLIDATVAKYTALLNIEHIKVGFKGLSKAKNFGISRCSGAYLSFPDDDCQIFENTYATALSELQKTGSDMVFGKCIDAEGKDSVLKFKTEAYQLSTENMLGGFVEATVLARKEVFEEFKFDENMGAGTFFGAEEGFDWLYRILTRSGFKASYSPKIKFYHPQVIAEKGDSASLQRVFSYRCGTAYLCVKHRFKLMFYKRLYLVKVAHCIYLFTNRSKADYYKMEWLGLSVGKILAKKQL